MHSLTISPVKFVMAFEKAICPNIKNQNQGFLCIVARARRLRYGMTTHSFLDALKSGLLDIQTPLQRAESAILRDDDMALKLILMDPRLGESELITEETVVHSGTKETLLHVSGMEL